MRLPGCRSATNSPTDAGAATEITNSTAPNGPSAWSMPRSSPITLSTAVATPVATAVAAITHATGRSTLDIPAIVPHQVCAGPEC